MINNRPLKVAVCGVGLCLSTFATAVSAIAHEVDKISTDVVYGLLDANGQVVDENGRFVGQLTEGRGGITVAKTGNSVPVSTALDITIDQRLHLARQALSTALASRWIDLNNFDQLNGKLDGIVAEKDKYTADGVLNFDEALRVGKKLDDLNTELTAQSRFQILSPVVVTINGSPRVSVIGRPPL